MGQLRGKRVLIFQRFPPGGKVLSTRGKDMFLKSMLGRRQINAASCKLCFRNEPCTKGSQELNK